MKETQWIKGVVLGKSVKPDSVGKIMIYEPKTGKVHYVDRHCNSQRTSHKYLLWYEVPK